MEGLDREQMMKNVRSTYERATDSDLATGLGWYKNARSLAKQIGEGNVVLGAGVIAAMSPMLPWKRNLEVAREGVRTGSFVGNYPANNKKADRILAGESPLEVLGGNKVRAFFSAIMQGGRSGHVVVDRHALAVVLGRNATETERGSLTDKRYELIADAYREVADQVGLTPSQLQAVTWITWRREKGIVD